MSTCFRMARAASRGALFAIILVVSISTSAQTSGAKTPRKPKPETSLEKKVVVNFLRDQGAIWTSPFHLERTDAKWLAPLGLSTMALITTDRYTSRELVEHGDNLSRLRISKDVSELGSLSSTGGVVGVLYLIGRLTHNDHLRETGLLGTAALIHSNVVARGLKTVSQRQRPPVDDSSGEFFDGGSSFPSGHAVNAWSVATVIAQEYGQHRPLVQIGVYGAATAVSLSRFTGRKHFLSDAVVGSAIGYGIGRFVYRKYHDPELDAPAEKQHNDLMQSKLFPQIVPLYCPRAHLYGGRLSWNF